MISANSTKKTVLVVEDEPLLLMLAADIVEDAGFEAVTAPNADKAIEVLLSRADIDIVFTDIDMPGSMDGLKLAAAIRDRWPPIEIIVTSGKAWPAKSELPDRGMFFPKPYDAARVTAMLQRMAA
ncbi:hypothetical protein RHAL1_02981 [Beijerinckiaceae bacterium RH AL1]|jgi:CheY-like chemotaxis protein|nr:response regulator [Beijerinckiaceae bacterium]VVB47767.1 hypothetical protein RHCH11_RHCH11_02919 [Beijerinckiaceae bacterium RH CH11]VVB47847.1 hypothetical protein RHAL8_02915 [Beijerinckiaceae bacterium RH AL8]VVC56055.1 hypothetical protein RHAL1_02981 [Beijerinckiaceae bacterium RH AL1]